jgi:hypothetical protein
MNSPHPTPRLSSALQAILPRLWRSIRRVSVLAVFLLCAGCAQFTIVQPAASNSSFDVQAPVTDPNYWFLLGGDASVHTSAQLAPDSSPVIQVDIVQDGGVLVQNNLTSMVDLRGFVSIKFWAAASVTRTPGFVFLVDTYGRRRWYPLALRAESGWQLQEYFINSSFAGQDTRFDLSRIVAVRFSYPDQLAGDKIWIGAVTFERIKIITYGMNLPENVSSYGISAIRGKIDLSSNSDMLDPYKEWINVLRNSNVYGLSPQDMVDEARYLAGVSYTLFKLTEISIDDFMDWYVAVKRTGDTLVLDQVIDAAKTGNPTLRFFGVTIYETDLPGGSLVSVADVLQEQRERIDVVHLYCHYRQNCGNLSLYVSAVRNWFASSKVVIGLYNYDRRKVEGRESTSTEQEVKMFSDSVKLACSLVTSGRANGIEFFPGYFGLETNGFRGDTLAIETATMMNNSALSILAACTQ